MRWVIISVFIHLVIFLLPFSFDYQKENISLPELTYRFKEKVIKEERTQINIAKKKDIEGIADRIIFQEFAGIKIFDKTFCPLTGTKEKFQVSLKESSLKGKKIFLPQDIKSSFHLITSSFAELKTVKKKDFYSYSKKKGHSLPDISKAPFPSDEEKIFVEVSKKAFKRDFAFSNLIRRERNIFISPPDSFDFSPLYKRLPFTKRQDCLIAKSLPQIHMPPSLHPVCLHQEKEKMLPSSFFPQDYLEKKVKIMSPEFCALKIKPFYLLKTLSSLKSPMLPPGGEGGEEIFSYLPLPEKSFSQGRKIEKNFLNSVPYCPSFSKGKIYTQKRKPLSSLLRSSPSPVVDAYLRRIFNIIQKKKVYPSLAREKGFEGKVGVSFTISFKGKVLEVEITSPCKYPELNEAAKKLIFEASPFPPFPPELNKKEIKLKMEVRYELEEKK